MFKLLSLELILFLGFTIFAGLLYLLIISYRSRKKNDDSDDDTDEPDDAEDDPAWRAKRFWWFGR